MITFKSFIAVPDVLVEAQYLVNRGVATKGGWQLRKQKPGERPSHVGEYEHLVLKNAKPWIDQRGVDEGEKIVAYIGGEKVSDEPTGSGRTLMYDPSKMPNPFRYADSKAAYTGSKYVVFSGKTVTVYE